MHPGSAPIAAAIAIGLYLLIAWAGFRWARSRVDRRAREIAESLRHVGVTVLAERPSGAIWRAAEIDIDHQGRKAKITVRQWGRDTQLISMVLPGPVLPGIWIRRERMLDRLGKSLGMEREVQLGIAEYDEALYIASSASDETVRQVLSGSENLRLIRETIGFGFGLQLSPNGITASTLKAIFGSFDGATITAVLERVEKLAKDLPRVDPSLATPGTKPLPSWAIVIPIALTALFPFFMLATNIGEKVHTPLAGGAIGGALLGGAVVWLVAIFAISRALQRRPFAMIETVIVAFATMLVIPFLTADGLFYANSAFDHGAVAHHHTRIVSHYKQNRRTVYVAPWDSSGAQQKIIIADTVPEVDVGDVLDIDSRPGAFGWEWVSSMQRGQ